MKFLGFLNTHPLWKNEQFGLQQFEMPAVDISSFQPKFIPTHLRLGHQVEYIFKQLVEHSGAYKVIAHNIQIKKGNDTIGELDFILEDIHFRESELNIESKLLHVELTYKFYILDPNTLDPVYRLMGPNRKDLFFTKMEKTRDRQMPLVFSPEGKKKLFILGIDANELLQQTYFLGQLFVPYGQQIPSIRPLNTDCIMGFWVRFDRFNSKEFKDYQFYIPYKIEWLYEPHFNVTWHNHFDILLDIGTRHINERAPMVWIRKEDDTLEKCFVVWW